MWHLIVYTMYNGGWREMDGRGLWVVGEARTRHATAIGSTVDRSTDGSRSKGHSYGTTFVQMVPLFFLKENRKYFQNLDI